MCGHCSLEQHVKQIDTARPGRDRQGGEGWKKFHSNPFVELDAHHISDRNLMPNKGYVIENGITVCSDCHLKVEQFHIKGVCTEGHYPEDLYRLIHSSLEEAIKASNNV